MCDARSKRASSFDTVIKYAYACLSFLVTTSRVRKIAQAYKLVCSCITLGCIFPLLSTHVRLYTVPAKAAGTCYSVSLAIFYERYQSAAWIEPIASSLARHCLGVGRETIGP